MLLALPSRLAFAALVALTGACAVLPMPPVTPSADEGFSPPVAIEPTGIDVNADQPAALRILPGDILRIQSQSVETTSVEGLVVDELGNVRVPLAGDVPVGGRTLEEASATVQEALRRFDRVVVVDVFMADAQGHQATVVGAVTNPGRVPVLPGMRVADLIAAVGGTLRSTETGEVQPLADLSGARLVRGEQVVPISIAQALTGDLRHNCRVRASDHLYIPPMRGNRIVILGNVNAPAAIGFRPGMRLTEALARAGGVTETGDRGDVRIVRGDLSAPRVYQATLDDIIDGDTTDVELAPGDVLYVSTHWTATWAEVVDLILIGEIFGTATTVGLAVALGQGQ